MNRHFRDERRPELECYTMMHLAKDMSDILIEEIFKAFKTEPTEKAREFAQKRLDFYKNNLEAKKALDNFYSRKTAREFFDQEISQIPFSLPQVLLGQFNAETLFPSIFVTFFDKVVMDEIRNVTSRLNTIGLGVKKNPPKLLNADLLMKMSREFGESIVDADRFFEELCTYYEIGLLPAILEETPETPADEGAELPDGDKRSPGGDDDGSDKPDKYM